MVIGSISTQPSLLEVSSAQLKNIPTAVNSQASRQNPTKIGQADDAGQDKPLYGNVTPSNLISRNFVKNSSQDSKYITAQFKSHQAQKSLGDKINSLVDILKTDVSDGKKYTQALRTRTGSERLIRELQATELNEQIEELNEQEPKERITGNGEEAAGVQSQGSGAESLENNPDTDASARDQAPAFSGAHPATTSSGGSGGNIDISV